MHGFILAISPRRFRACSEVKLERPAKLQIKSRARRKEVDTLVTKWKDERAASS